jgi:hypothetical protein
MRELRIACNADHVSNIPLEELNLEKLNKMEASLKLCLLSAISIPKKAYLIITSVFFPAYYFLKVLLHNFSKIRSQKEVTKQ